MGKVVPFARKISCERGGSAAGDSLRVGLQGIAGAAGNEKRAEQLIGEAAQLLAEAGHGDVSVPWILEDCIELLRNKDDNESGAALQGSGSSKLRVTAASECEGSRIGRVSSATQPDPRLKLNSNPEVSTFVRK